MDKARKTTASAQASGYDQRFHQWWSIARQSEEPPSPYDFLVNFGVHPEVVQPICWDILDHTCQPNNQTIRPGLVGHFVRHLFFTNQVKDESFRAWKRQNYKRSAETTRNNEHNPFLSKMLNAIRLGPPGSNPTRISFQDIISLVDLVNQTFSYREFHGVLDVVVNECMRLNYNGEILQLICDKMRVNASTRFCLSFSKDSDGEDESPAHRQAVDHHCLMGLETLLPKLDSLDLHSGVWIETAFVKCIDMLRNATALKNVTMHLPKQFLEDSTKPSTLDHPEDSPGDEGSPCGIEHLFIIGSRSEEHGNKSCGGLAAVQLLSSMPNLKQLYLGSLGSLSFKAAAPYIIQIMHNDAGLESLHIANKDSSSDELDVIGVMEALKAATSLECFHYSQRFSGETVKLSLYANKLAEVLEQNTKLTTVILEDHTDADYSDTEFSVKTTDYYLDLNRYGRSIARDSNTTLADFVGLLCEKRLLRLRDDNDLFLEDFVGYEYEDEDEREADLIQCFRAFNIQYGLLRESPGLWSGAAWSPSHTDCRKRKLCG